MLFQGKGIVIAGALLQHHQRLRLTSDHFSETIAEDGFHCDSLYRSAATIRDLAFKVRDLRAYKILRLAHCQARNLQVRSIGRFRLRSGILISMAAQEEHARQDDENHSGADRQRNPLAVAFWVLWCGEGFLHEA